MSGDPDDFDDLPPPSPAADRHQAATRPRQPFLQAPIYLSPAQPPAAVVRACRDNAPRLAGLVGATALGVTAAYFAPRFFDWALERFGGHPADLELEIEDEPDE